MNLKQRLHRNLRRIGMSKSAIRAATAIAILLSAALFNGVAAQVKTAASAVPQFRTIKVVTQPAATVWIDGVRYGKTGKNGVLEVRTVSVGGHSLRVRADGFKEKSMPLTAVQKGEIKVPLVVTSDPAELAFQEAERLSLVDREKAAEAYRKAAKLRPNYPEAFLALARVLSETGDLDEAASAIASARKLRPVYPEATAVLARIYKDGGEEDKTIASFKKAVTEGKGFQPEALTGLGLLYKERAEGLGASGDFEGEKANYAESAKYLRSALKQLSGAPDALVVYQLIGLIYERLENYDEAIAVYEEFLRIFPDSSEATAVRSFIVQLQKQKP
jgi:tetratricopeptide (TPR) repeat protein